MKKNIKIALLALLLIFIVHVKLFLHVRTGWESKGLDSRTGYSTYMDSSLEISREILFTDRYLHLDIGFGGPQSRAIKDLYIAFKCEVNEKRYHHLSGPQTKVMLVEVRNFVLGWFAIIGLIYLAFVDRQYKKEITM